MRGFNSKKKDLIANIYGLDKFWESMAVAMTMVLASKIFCSDEDFVCQLEKIFSTIVHLISIRIHKTYGVGGLELLSCFLLLMHMSMYQLCLWILNHWWIIYKRVIDLLISRNVLHQLSFWTFLGDFYMVDCQLIWLSIMHLVFT